MESKSVLVIVAVAMAIVAGSASATVLVYEPFDYEDAALNGQGGAVGTTGTWTTNDTGFAAGWWCHPGGATSGVFVAVGVPNVFDGMVDNMATSGGFVGMAGPEDRGLAAGTDSGTGNLDANIGLDSSVTATFKSGTTTWFSYVGAHAWDRNAGSPTLMICTDPTTNGSRGLTMQNSGNGIGGVGGPPRSNLFDVYPHYFSGGVHHQTPGGYQDGVFGTHDGIVSAFVSTGTGNGVLDEAGQPRTQTMGWRVSDDDGFGAANIVVGKIEWDADTGGEDIISVVRFLEDETLSEAAFNALVAARPPLSSANWASNKPDLNQSQFDTLNISSLKFFVDEIRIGTSFIDVVSGNGPTRPSPYNGQTVGPSSDLPLNWVNADPNNPADSVYVDVWFGTDPNDHNDFDKVYATLEDVNSVPVDAPDDGTYYWQVNSYLYGDPGVVVYDTNGNDPNKPPIIGGSLWKFYVVSDVPPVVEIVTNDQMTWSGEGSPLDATVTDDAVSALTVEWSADDLPAGMSVAFNPGNDVADTIVTLTKFLYSTEASIINAGFEDAVLADGEYTGAAGWGWSGVSYRQVTNPYAPGGDTTGGNLWPSFGGVAPEGNNIAQTGLGGIAQVLTDTLAADTTYTLTAEVGNAEHEHTWDGYRVQLLAGGTPSEGEITEGTILAEDDSTLTIAPGTFVTVTVVFDSTGVDPDLLGEPLQIRLLSGPTAEPIHFDDVQLTADPGFIPTGVQTVTMTIVVGDEGAPEADSASIEIDVYDDACHVAQVGLGRSAATDFNGDCITALEDLAAAAAAWLNDFSSTGPQDK